MLATLLDDSPTDSHKTVTFGQQGTTTARQTTRDPVGHDQVLYQRPLETAKWLVSDCLMFSSTDMGHRMFQQLAVPTRSKAQRWNTCRTWNLLTNIGRMQQKSDWDIPKLTETGPCCGNSYIYRPTSWSSKTKLAQAEKTIRRCPRNVEFVDKLIPPTPPKTGLKQFIHVLPGYVQVAPGRRRRRKSLASPVVVGSSPAEPETMRSRNPKKTSKKRLKTCPLHAITMRSPSPDSMGRCYIPLRASQVARHRRGAAIALRAAIFKAGVLLGGAHSTNGGSEDPEERPETPSQRMNPPGFGGSTSGQT